MGIDYTAKCGGFITRSPGAPKPGAMQASLGNGIYSAAPLSATVLAPKDMGNHGTVPSYTIKEVSLAEMVSTPKAPLHPDTEILRDVVRQRDELIRERDELKKNLHRAYIDGQSRRNDALGELRNVTKERDQAKVDCEFFRRELERERAKNKRRGL